MGGVARVLVLGHRGMLGHTVATWLRQQRFSVLTTTTRHPHGLVDEVTRADADAVINCIAKTPKDTNSSDDLFSTNALLPQLLAAALAPNRILVHASTDGVFDGKRGRYTSTERTNATDPYGLSKRLGEAAIHLGNVVVIRCSIVGLEVRSTRNLLSWFLAQNTEIVGYTDHHWNGVTTLEWAKVAALALRGDPAITPGIHQPACAEPVTKYSLLKAAACAFDHQLDIVPRDSGFPVDRTLYPTIPGAPIERQLEGLRSWHEESGIPYARFGSDSNS